jgi:hypothetical protein
MKYFDISTITDLVVVELTEVASDKFYSGSLYKKHGNISNKDTIICNMFTVPRNKRSAVPCFNYLAVYT